MEKGTNLPSIVDSEIDPKIQNEVEKKLISYFLKHGITVEVRTVAEKDFPSPPVMQSEKLNPRNRSGVQNRPEYDISPMTDRADHSLTPTSSIASNTSPNVIEKRQRHGFNFSTPVTSFRTSEDDYSVDSWQPFSEKRIGFKEAENFILSLPSFPGVPEYSRGTVPNQIPLEQKARYSVPVPVAVTEKTSAEFTTVKKINKIEKQVPTKQKIPPPTQTKSSLTSKDLEFR
jgi:hypothetical protein